MKDLHRWSVFPAFQDITYWCLPFSSNLIQHPFSLLVSHSYFDVKSIDQAILTYDQQNDIVWQHFLSGIRTNLIEQ